jgi:hypothetical protein
MSMFGMIVEAARVDVAYEEGAYPYTDFVSIERAEVDKLAECPLAKGILGRRSVGCLSRPKDPLRLELASK